MSPRCSGAQIDLFGAVRQRLRRTEAGVHSGGTARPTGTDRRSRGVREDARPQQPSITGSVSGRPRPGPSRGRQLEVVALTQEPRGKDKWPKGGGSRCLFK
jgi:hypothetical protein